ncbi:MAG: TatD family hydrolase [Candidatus Omnitrophota bacterium]
MLVDTHCHLDFPEFDADRKSVLERARESGVEVLINVGSSLKGSREAVSLASQYPQVFASVGIHPHDAKEYKKEDLSQIKQLVLFSKVVAIGEIGLDYYRNLSEPKIQRSVFKEFLNLACEAGLPVIIHSRQAEDDTLAVLREFELKKFKGIVIHCFSAGMDFLNKCLDLGFFVSFTCNVTYKKAQVLRKIVEYVPLDKMFLETDAPFLPPEGKRGKRNEPAYLADLAHEVARIKNIDFDMVCAETTRNAKHFFKLV